MTLSWWTRAVRCGVLRARRAGQDPSPSLRIVAPLYEYESRERWWAGGGLRAAAVMGGGSRCGQPEQPGGVLLEDLRFHLVLDRQLVEVGEPPVGGEDGVVGAEE